MKELKKLLCGLVAAMMIFTLAACGEKAEETKEEAKTEETAPTATEAPAEEEDDADVAGSYVAVDATMGEEEMSEEEAAMLKEMLSSFTLELKDDNTALMNLGEDEPEELEYTVEGDTITLTAEGESLSGTIEDGKIVLDFSPVEEGMTVTFEKE
ncbi:MAG: hypothetical protein J5590_04960 [Clostridia bacterium]|nr:hypothetical protein [Clostridia bacterium]